MFPPICLRQDPRRELFHAQAGDRAIALWVYHQCMTLLQEELGVPPARPSISSMKRC
ncbi:hypothetical protein C7271_08490 [filamentous cyanobacterium CCP5]|nr:hypothetical protein C7271_08490 [filamentous cyanobacterium CCP5]